MKLLVIGCGGREYSIVMKLKESKKVNEIYAIPGNGGIEQHATCIDINQLDVTAIVKFAEKEKIDLTIVGPENSLNAGIVDAFNEKNLPIFGPTKAAAMLEGSKTFAKNFMKKYDIPTAVYRSFSEPE